MARVTVEDCMNVVENRFELVVVASQRAKDISSGSPLTVERDNDKNPVIALREIANKNVDTNTLREAVIRNLQKRGKFDSHEDDAEVAEEGDNMDSMEMELLEDVENLTIASLNDEGDLSFGDDNLDVDD
jgi:DNA-directed RNA polymerase subunit omega